MRILVGTKNKRKLEAVERVVENMKITDNHTVDGCDVSSEVSDTPLGIKTKQGAISRAKNAAAYNSDYEMYIGIESGLVERYDDLFEEVWVAVIYEDIIYSAYSSGLKLPDNITAKLGKDIESHPEIMRCLREQNEIEVCKTLGVDTWGDYTGGKISREVGLEEAIRNTLIQIFPGEKSFYHSV